ncbi:MAG: ribosome biogenesis GTP-binding protein YihA/YsxC [Acidobacteriota bacterium]
MKIKSAEFAIAATAPAHFLRDGRPEIVFAGRSNVGKSSLINRMLQRKKLARTSSSPGRTRMVNYFLVNDAFYFVDIPGYGYAKVGKAEREKWAEVIDQYLRHEVPQRLLVLLVDGKIAGTALDAEAVDYFSALDLSFIVAVTKIDKVSRNKRTKSLTATARKIGLPETVPMVPVSAQTGEGIQELWRSITPTLS